MTTTERPRIDVLHTACTLDCPDACSLAVTVTDGRITNIDASPLNELTQGWICSKVKRQAKRVYAPERVMTPLIRIGAKGEGIFREATWDEAMALIGTRMHAAVDSAGPDAIVGFTYNSSAGKRESSSLTDAFFAAIGATEIDHTICAATADASWQSVYLGMRSADPLDVVHAQLVVVWGANPTVSNTHFPPLVQQAVDNGAKLVVIDPRRTAMAKRADLHLAVRPGTDIALAMAVANYWVEHEMVDYDFLSVHADGGHEFLTEAASWSIERAAEVSGLDAGDIVTFAEWYGTTKPSMLRIGWGQERNSNGGAACRAILALPVLANHFGVTGGGTIGSTSSGLDMAALWPSFDERERRHLPLHQVGAWLAPGAGDPCQVLIIQGSNPVVMSPDTKAVVAALSRDDVFTVVHEQVRTDTTRYADVVLPATTAFEIDDLASGYGTYTVQRVRPVIDRVGESRSNDEFGVALAAQFGWEWSTGRPAQVNDADDDLRVSMTGVVQFVMTEPRGGKAQLVDPVQGVPRYVPVAHDYPLQMISPASSKLVNSMFGEFQSPEPFVTLHPDDAAARGLTAGQAVRMVNALGAVDVDLAISDDIRPGVAIILKGIWLRNFADQRGVNELTPATGDALVNGACFNDTFIDVVAR
jgi:anaerobic selenocysteine-containing dehydrogenase